MTKIKKALLSVLCCFALIFCSAFVFTACTRADMTAYNITIDEAIQSGWVKVIGDPIAGEEITIVLNPGTGYEIVPGSLKVNGEEVVGNTFIMPEGNVKVTAKFKKINYAVSTGDVEHGTVDIEIAAHEILSGETTEWGTKVTLTPVPEKGYECTHLEVLNGGLQVLVTKEGDKYSFNMPQGNITINATFEKITYSLAKASEHGTFTIPATANYGDTIEVTGITPDPGYVFSKIIFNGNTITGTSFKMPDSNTTVQVVFKAVEYTVSIANNVEHANIRLLKSGSSHYFTSLKAYYGDTITVSVTPDEGYEVSAIKVNGEAISGNSFVVTENSEVTVELTAIDYSITVNPSENGSIVPDKTTAIVGEMITLTISPDATYNIETLTIKNGDLNVLGTIDGNTATFTMPAGNVTISATFASEGFAINIVSYEGSNIYANRVAVAEGTKVYIVDASVDAEQLGLGVYICLADPQPGYEFSDSGASLYWAGGDLMGAVQMEQGPNGEDLAYFEMPAGEVTLDFECRKKTAYQITKGETTNGSFDLSANSAYEGDYITITVHPAEGYELDEVYVNGYSYYQNLGFTMQGSDITVRVTFKKATYTITREGATEHGYFDVQDQAQYGEEVVITEQNTEAGYEAVFTVTCNGTPVTVTNNKFIMPAGNVTISVSYTPISYTISVYESIEGNIENGSVSFDPTLANMGDEITITVTPNDGYSLKAISVLYDANNDGNYQTLIPAKTANENEYVFTMIPYDVKIRAWFGIKSSITANETTNGTVEITGVTSAFDETFTANATEAFEGDTVTITATPSAGYSLKSLKVNNGTVATTETSEGVFTFAMPAKAVSVTAEYEGVEYTITKNPTTNGSFTVSKTTANYNDEITITVTPATGYELGQILVDGVALEVGITSFTMPAKDVTVSVTFKAINYTITKNITGDGVVKVKDTATYGETINITVPNSKDYVIKEILIFNDSTPVEITKVSDITYKFIMPAGSVQIKAVFGYYLLTIDDIDYTIDGTDLTITNVKTQNTSYEIPSTFTIGGVEYTVRELNGENKHLTSGVGISGSTKNIILPSTLTTIGKFTFSYVALKSIVIPSSVITINDFAFEHCALTSITFEENSNCEIIGVNAFYSANKLLSINIPDSVTSIGAYAFNGCTSLVSITIGKGVTSIGDSTPFAGCTSLVSITVDENNEIYTSIDENVCIIETATNTLVAGCENTVIPNSVTSIGDGAFKGCTGLTSITIPEGVTSIGISVFEGCTGLTSITIPSSVTSIGMRAFLGCAGLTSITIPEGVTSIGISVFEGCLKLSSITIPSSVTSIGGNAFNGCTGLTSITIPDSVTSIGKYAFNDCEGLTSVTIGSGVTSIGQGAFCGCTGLTKVIIGNSVTSIGLTAFCGCEKLTTITFEGTTPPTIGSAALSGCTSLTTIYVPAGTKSAYVTAFVTALGSDYASKIVEKA